MTVVPGEYVFKCLECDGEGSIEVIIGEDETVWERCPDCGGAGEQFVDDEEAAEYIDCGHTPLRTPEAVGHGEADCPRCGTTFDVEETRAGFDHYYAESAGWKWDDLPQRLCRECAESDVETRWMDGTLDAADGPPPSADEMADDIRRLGLANEPAQPSQGVMKTIWKKFRG